MKFSSVGKCQQSEGMICLHLQREDLPLCPSGGQNFTVNRRYRFIRLYDVTFREAETLNATGNTNKNPTVKQLGIG
jgi:hypothetical protein